jgi:putative acetyltransferase
VIEIREERPTDIAAVRHVNSAAFEQDQEANLVDALRSAGAVLLSLVAVVDGEVVGHIFYSPASIGEVGGAALAPMAVLPDRQHHGIGTQLVETGNRMLKASGCPFVLVVGHPRYYPRFGFVPARPLGITCEWEMPDDVFMVVVFNEVAMRGVTGLAKYRAEFSNA